MFVKTKHARGVTRLILLRAIYYVYINPKNGYLVKIRERFGAGARLLLNTELALTTIIKNLPGRHPGMIVGIDIRNIKRFGKIVEKTGLKAISYDGDRELLDLVENTRVLAVVVPDSYDAMTSRRKNKFEASSPIKIIYQNRKRPKSVSLLHDIYLWEPRSLPRTVCGAVIAIPSEKMAEIKEEIKLVNKSKPRLPANSFIREIFYATRGYENRYRRVDKSPPRVLARMLYDFYK